MKSTARSGFQKSLLPRLLSGQAARVQELGVQPVRLIGPFKAACPVLCNLLGDSNIKIAQGVRYYHSSVSKTDILYFADGSAAVVQNIFTNDVEHFFLLQKLHRVRSCVLGNSMAKRRKSRLWLRSLPSLGLCRLGGVGKTTWSRVSSEKRSRSCVAVVAGIVRCRCGLAVLPL